MIDIRNFCEVGFTVVKNFLSPRTIDTLKDEIGEPFSRQIFLNNTFGKSHDDSVVKLAKKNKQCFVNAAKLAQNSWAVNSMCTSNRMFLTLRSLGLEKPAIATKPVIFFSHKDLAELTPKHVDYYSMCSSLNSVVAFLPLVDITESNGPLMVVPGSHLKANGFSEIVGNFAVVNDYEDKEFKPILLEAGDLLLFSAWLCHKSSANTTKDIRLVVTYRYTDVLEQNWIDRGYPNPYKNYPAPTSDMLPDYSKAREYLNEFV